MFKNRAIRYVFLATLIAGILFPLINIYHIYPSFIKLLIENTENEALRLGQHLSTKYFHQGRPVSHEDIMNIKKNVEVDAENFHLMKLKIFSPSGEILYSSNEKEIGSQNLKEYFHNIVAKGKPFTLFVKKDTASIEGQTVTSDVIETYVPVMSNGKFIGAFEIYYDITERTRKLNKVIRYSATIPFALTLAGLFLAIFVLIRLDKSMTQQHETEKRLQLYTEKLQQSNREFQDFAHIASHDLQEPLRKVTAFGDRLKAKYADKLGEQGCDYLERMQNAASRMQKLIQGLLVFSRVATKAKPFEPVDLNTVASEVLSDLEVRIQETGGQVSVNELPTISADPLQMRQLLQNLIGNALKFQKDNEQPAINVSAELLNGDGDETGIDRSYRISVRDNGIGFDNKYAGRIFGVFQRLHGRQEYEGSGIGLSVCKRIVERHGGNITAESTPGDGTTFIITLPARQGNEENQGEAEPVDITG